MDIGAEKVDIQSLISQKASDFNDKTVVHIHRMFDSFGYGEVFDGSAVEELLELQNSSASKLLSKLVQAAIIESVQGKGKGKYKFSRD